MCQVYASDGGMENIPEIVLLYCSRAVKPEAQLSEVTRTVDGAHVRAPTLPCGSKVETLALLQMIQSGTHGIVVVCCPEANCQFVSGSRHAAGRVLQAQALLAETGNSPERIKFLSRTDLDSAALDSIVKEHALALKTLGSAVATG